MKRKKIVLTILLAAVLAAGNLMTVIARPSPTPHPIVRNRLVITPYSQYETIMDEPSRKLMPVAYAQITVPELYKAFPVVEGAARQLGLDPASCYAGDLFDATYYAKEDEGKWYKCGFVGSMAVPLPCAAPERFVCVLHYHDDAWTLENNVQVDYQGKQVIVQADSMSPFAVIVSDSNTPRPVPDPKKGGSLEGGSFITSPQTGYDLVTEVYLTVKEWLRDLFD